MKGYTFQKLEGAKTRRVKVKGWKLNFAKGIYKRDDLAWGKLLGANGNEAGTAVAIDSTGAVYVTGTTAGDMDGNKNAGRDDAFLSKFDSNGTKLWTKLLGSDGWDYGNGIAIDSTGSVYVTGSIQRDMDGNTNFDAFISKFDSNGTKLWTKFLGSNDGWDYGNGIAIDPIGSVYVTGNTTGDMDGNKNTGGWDVFLSKFDSSGKKLWTKLLGSKVHDYGNGVAIDSTGAVYVTGDTTGDLDGNKNAGAYDAFLSKFDSSGNMLWTKLLGSKGWDSGYGVATDSTGAVYVTCEFFVVTAN